jgi:predicted enzyme related to lactoylglutathione lyase
LVAAGRLDYDLRLAETWPEFAMNGKGEVTVRHVLMHQAGVPGLPSDLRTAADRIERYMSPMITRLDFIGIPSQDADRARSFYRETLGLRPDEHGDYEQWAGDTCFGIWEPKKVGIPFVAQKGNPWAFGCEDVAATRAELEAKGVEFAGDIVDTGVCRMAFFSDPDGNDLMLHHRYAPYA